MHKCVINISTKRNDDNNDAHQLWERNLETVVCAMGNEEAKEKFSEIQGFWCLRKPIFFSPCNFSFLHLFGLRSVIYGMTKNKKSFENSFWLHKKNLSRWFHIHVWISATHCRREGLLLIRMCSLSASFSYPQFLSCMPLKCRNFRATSRLFFPSPTSLGQGMPRREEVTRKCSKAECNRKLFIFLQSERDSNQTNSSLRTIPSNSSSPKGFSPENVSRVPSMHKGIKCWIAFPLLRSQTKECSARRRRQPAKTLSSSSSRGEFSNESK